MKALFDYVATMNILQFILFCLCIICATTVICFFLRCFWKDK